MNFIVGFDGECPTRTEGAFIGGVPINIVQVAYGTLVGL